LLLAIASKDLTAVIQEMSFRLGASDDMKSETENYGSQQPPSYEAVHDTEAKQPVEEMDIRDKHSTQKKFTHASSSSEDSDSDDNEAGDTEIKTLHPIKDRTDLLKQIESLQKEQEALRKKQEVHERHIKDLLESEPSLHRRFKSLRTSFSERHTSTFSELKNVPFLLPPSFNEVKHSKLTDKHIYVQLEQLYANFHVLHFPSKTAQDLLSDRHSGYTDAYSISEVTSLRNRIQELEEQLQTISNNNRTLCLPAPEEYRTNSSKPQSSSNRLRGIPGQPTPTIPVLPVARDLCPVEVTFKWTIANYFEKLRQEKATEGCKEISSPFYLTHCGYRAQIEAYLNGNGTGRDSCMSVFLRIIKGDYDQRMKWPVNLHLVVILVNQADSSCDSLKAMGNQFQYNRPCGSSEAESDCWGLIEFVSHDVTRQRQYIKDGKIVLKCRVQIN
jgi:regulator of replication initiation timing